MSFSDNHFDGTTIYSVWKSDRNVRQNQTQTENIETLEKGISVVSTNSIETQTLDLIDSHKIRPLKTFDSPELTRFVTKASELTLEIIRKTKNTEIIERIERFQNQNKTNVRMIYKFYKQLDSISEDKQHNYVVSSVCWNCNASVLVVGYKVKTHTDWCTHSSYLLFWSLYKTSQSEEPTILLEIESCVSTLISHPKEPSLYITGALNGKISVWNTRNTDDCLITSVTAHQNTVSVLHWIPSKERSDLGRIVSTGLDGKVLVWKISEKRLELEEAFVVLTEDMPKSMQIKRDNNEVGIVSMSFNCDDPNIFIIGCIGGPLFQCSLINGKSRNQNNIFISEELKNIEFKSPVVMSYVSHRSHITCVEFSPNSRNTFFSCSSDNELRIYNILQTIPLLVIHTEVPIVSGQWSTSRPNIVAVGADGRVYIYCITDTKVSKAALSFAIGDEMSAKSVVFNTIENNEQIAVISSNNEIQIWDLSSVSEKTDSKNVNHILNQLTNDYNN